MHPYLREQLSRSAGFFCTIAGHPTSCVDSIILGLTCPNGLVVKLETNQNLMSWIIKEKALAGLHGCSGLHQPLLVRNGISTKIS